MRSKITQVFLSFIAVAILLVSDASAQRNNASLDSLKIVYYGSSVPAGFGATNMFGYTSRFTEILKQRAAEGKGKAWAPVNKSIGGDNTIKLRARWQRDLVPQKAKYVLIALSLGNEGIHEAGQARYEQFRTNMAGLIQLALDSGYVPVLANCYVRNDFTPADYYFVKQMNMWIHTLDVPSINLLGGVDNGEGHWAPAYWNDGAHPNNKGHQELAYTVVPSLFDALSNGKPQPAGFDSANEGMTLNSRTVVFQPDNITHSYTTSIAIKADKAGRIIQLRDSLHNLGSISIIDNGVVEYKSPLQQKITGTTVVTDGKWHTITLTNYYARNATILYTDSKTEGTVSEQISIKELTLGNSEAKNVKVRNWLFYRSGMNPTEADALANGMLLRSSLELYAPLDAKKDVLRNLAQSMNVLR
jgi:lysophospholipase L1-like esterase